MMPIGSRRRRKRRSHRRRLLDQPSSTEPAFVDHQQGEGALAAINTSASSSVSSSSSSFSAQSSSLLQVVPESNVFVKKSAASNNPDGIHLFLANSSCSTSATTTLNESWEQELSAPIESSASLGQENFVSTSSSSHYGIVSSIPSIESSRIQELHHGDRFAMETELTIFENGSKSGKKKNFTYKKMQPCLQTKNNKSSILDGHRRTIRRRGEFFRYHNRRKFQKVIVVTTAGAGGTRRNKTRQNDDNDDDNSSRNNNVASSVPRFPMYFILTSIIFLLCVYFPETANTLAESSIKGFNWIQRHCVEPILLLPTPESDSISWSNEMGANQFRKRSRRYNAAAARKPIRISRGGRAGIVY